MPRPLGRGYQATNEVRRMAEENTHFGYQTVAESEKAAKVAQVFHSVASRYDVMNDLKIGRAHV